MIRRMGLRVWGKFSFKLGGNHIERFPEVCSDFPLTPAPLPQWRGKFKRSLTLSLDGEGNSNSTKYNQIVRAMWAGEGCQAAGLISGYVEVFLQDRWDLVGG